LTHTHHYGKHPPLPLHSTEVRVQLLTFGMLEFTPPPCFGVHGKNNVGMQTAGLSLTFSVQAMLVLAYRFTSMGAC
jgi:hypothetical protein